MFFFRKLNNCEWKDNFNTLVVKSLSVPLLFNQPVHGDIYIHKRERDVYK